MMMHSNDFFICELKSGVEERRLCQPQALTHNLHSEKHQPPFYCSQQRLFSFSFFTSHRQRTNLVSSLHFKNLLTKSDPEDSVHLQPWNMNKWNLTNPASSSAACWGDSCDSGNKMVVMAAIVVRFYLVVALHSVDERLVSHDLCVSVEEGLEPILGLLKLLLRYLWKHRKMQKKRTF